MHDTDGNGNSGLDRRDLMQAGLAVGVAAFASSCGVAQGNGHADADPDTVMSAYHLPPETAPHERTFMQWPVNPEVYDDKMLRGVQNSIALIANTISQFEPVVMLASGDDANDARALLGNGVEIWDIPTDDLWCRDSGPIFVKNAAGELAVSHIQFNGWGNKQPHRQDALIAERLAARLGLPLLPTGLVGELGGVEDDGAGTLLAHASSWVNANRNSGTAAEIGDDLLEALGAQKIIWAPGIAGADITDYHIDSLARFVGPGRVLIQMPEVIDPKDPWSRAAFQTLAILRKSTDAQGRRLAITVIKEPVDIRSDAEDFVSSYVNYYVCNGAVISAEFGDKRADSRARAQLAALYPGRKIISLNIDAIGAVGGGIHCATQQHPKAG